MATREIARRLGVIPKAVRKLLKRLGWHDQDAVQMGLPIAHPRGDPSLSALSITPVPHAGVLCALPALVDSGIFRIARDIYGSLGPAFYGLRTTLVALSLMALLRIKRPEGLKEHVPDDLGRLLGLDRAFEVKTLRRKLTRLACVGRAAAFGRALAEYRIAARGTAIGFLYVDGHVRVYHGRRTLPKAHVARMRLAMPATTDYWVNDVAGQPFSW